MKHHPKVRFAALIAAMAAGGAFFSATASAASTETWTMGAGDGTGNWNSSANWTGTNLPPVSGDSLTFGATTGPTSLTNDYAVFTTSTITFAAGANAYVIGGNTLNLSSQIKNLGTNLETFANNLNLGVAGATIATSAGGGDVTLGGLISASGSNNFIKTGLGTLTLDGSTSNMYSGPSVIRGGTFVLDFANLASGTDLLKSGDNITLQGANVDIKGRSTGSTSQTLGIISTSSLTASHLILDANGGSGTTIHLDTLIGPSLGSLVIDMSSPGAAIILAHPVTQTIYTGILLKDATGIGWATTSGANVVRYDDTTGATLTSGSLDPSQNYTTVHSGASVNLSGASQDINSLAIDTTHGGQSIDLGGGTLGLTSDELLFRGSNAATISNGQIGDANSLVTIEQVGTGKLTISAAVNSGNGSLTKAGSGEVILSANNSYGGSTNIEDGTLTVTGSLGGTINAGGGAASSGFLPVLNLNATNAFNGSLTLNSPDAVVNVNASNGLGSGTTFTLHAGTLNLNAPGLFGTNFTIPTGVTLGVGDDGALSTVGVILTGGTVQANGGARTLSNFFSQGQFSSTFGGRNDLTLTGTFINTRSGSLTISNTGKTTLAGGVGLNTGATLTIQGPGTLVISSPVTELSGTGSLTFTGTGTTILSAANTYTGATTVTSGTVLANNATDSGTGSGSVAVGSAGTLGGTGTISGDATIDGTLAPGDSTLAVASQTGTFSTGGAVTFDTGSTFAVQLGGTLAGSFDQLAIANTDPGNLSLATGVTLTLNWVGASAPTPGDTFEIIDRSGTGTFSTLFNGTTEGGIVIIADTLGGIYSQGLPATITYQGGTGNDVVLTYVNPVPEPREVALGVVAMLGTIVALRHRRRIVLAAPGR